jgi:endoglucanase
MKRAKKDNWFKEINIVLSVAVTALLLCVVAPLYALSPLHVEGNKIKDAEGHVVVLRGLSSPDIGTLHETYGLTDYIDRVTDMNDTNGSYTGWYTKVIRYPVCPSDSDVNDSPLLFNPDDINDPNNEAIYEALKEAVDYGAQKGVYSIVLWNYAKPIADRVAETNAFWNFMAPKFADDANVIFELYSEPTDDAGTWNMVKGRMQAWTNIVRTYTTENLVLVTGPCWAQQIGPAVLSSNPVTGGNIVYTMHFYGKTWRNSQLWVDEQISAVAPVYPVMVSAWGWEPNDDPNIWSSGSAEDFGEPLKEYLEELGIGNIACCAGYNWSCYMFDPNWQLRCGDYMGCFVKDWLYEKRNAERFSTLTVTKCKITAGKTQGLDSDDINNIKDSFTFSGTFGNIPIDFTQTSSIDVNITSADETQIYFESIDCNSSRISSSGKFGYKYKIPKYQPGAITSLSIDPVGRKFSIAAKNVDLTGLTCPVHLEIAMGYYTLTGDVNEAIVNGRSTLIPTRLMRMYDDTLVVTKASAKHSTTPFSDSMSAKGCLAVANIDDANLCNVDVNFIWGEQVFNIPQGRFTASKTGHLYKCSKVVADANYGNAGIVTASIDIDKAIFTVSLKAADSLDVLSDFITFGVNFSDFNETADVNRVTKRSY